MAAGDAFTSLTPNFVTPINPDYHNKITPSESMKKEYLNMAATPVEQWRLKFSALSSANMNTLLTHVKDQSDGYYEFSWQTVPSHVNGGANITGHWVQGSLSITPSGTLWWTVEITFEKSN